jgi:hypothetical protein
MPRKVIAWSCVFLGIVMLALVFLQAENRSYLGGGAAVLLVVGAAMLLSNRIMKKRAGTTE